MSDPWTVKVDAYNAGVVAGLHSAAGIVDAHIADYRLQAAEDTRSGSVDDLEPSAREIATAESIRDGIAALIKESKPS